MAAPLRGRPAHAPGPTYFTYTPNGRKLITAGANGAFRIFEHQSDDEPAILDVRTDSHLAIVARNDWIIVGAEDGSVTKYSLLTMSMDDILTRCASPVRDLALSADGAWVAVASDDSEVKIVNTANMVDVKYIRDLASSAKHVAFDQTGSQLAISCLDGRAFVYSVRSGEPELKGEFRTGILRVNSESAISIKSQWHPDNKAITVPNSANAYAFCAVSDLRQRNAFAAHTSNITAAAWSPNGALLATAALDKQLLIWNARTQRVIRRIEDIPSAILSLQWHPTDNVLAYTNSNGELFIRDQILNSEMTKLLDVALEPAPLLPASAPALQEMSANVQRPGGKHDRAEKEGNIDDLDEFWADARGSEDGDGFIEDDDGAGYAEITNVNGKRTRQTDDSRPAKRAIQAELPDIQEHEAFQPGSTPWRGNRRYLCLNLVGFVWTVDQETHHTATVEFYDRQAHRDFHFSDPYGYDKACLNNKGTLFSSLPKNDQPAMIFYRPHETWTTRHDWRITLPPGESVTSMSLSETCIVATTSEEYVRIYSLFGLPLQIYRQKSTPAVTCASWRDYVMTVGNGALGSDMEPRLLYTIENVKRQEVYQSEDILPLPPSSHLRSVFFSDQGDPCIFDSRGILLILTRWRTPGQARWVPLLDTKRMDRLASGLKDESYWPVAVAHNKFHCIILKGGEKYPYFPRPLLSDFEFQIPIAVTTDEDNNDLSTQQNLEEQYIRASVQHSLLSDLVDNTNASAQQKTEVGVLEREIDKALLQLMGNDCREGEDRGMRALEIASLLRDRSGRMLEAAGKIAARFQRDILGDKISQLAERRLVGLVEDDDL